MKLVLAEKPSVAQSIAKVLGAAKREDGYLEGNGYVVSWCVGHLVELAQPEVYDAKYSKWAYADLPIFPMDWQYEVSAGTKKQFGIPINMTLFILLCSFLFFVSFDCCLDYLCNNQDDQCCQDCYESQLQYNHDNSTHIADRLFNPYTSHVFLSPSVHNVFIKFLVCVALRFKPYDAIVFTFNHCIAAV